MTLLTAKTLATLSPTPSPKGIYMPKGWNANWSAALSGASSKPTVAFVGDSVTVGLWSSSMYAKGWPGLLRAALQARYGSGGDGFIGEGQSTAAQSGSWEPVDIIQCSAGISEYAGSIRYTGPGAGLLGTTASYGSPQTFTITRSGDVITPYIYGGSANGAFSITVDGNSVAGSPFTPPGATTLQRVGSSSGNGTGQHTVVITVAAGQPVFYLAGVGFENSSGVVCNTYAHGGYRAQNFADTTVAAASRPPMWSGGPSYPCHLLVYALAINDAIAGTAGDTYLGYVRTFMETIRNYGSPEYGNTDILFIIPHIGKDDNATPVYHQYSERMRGMAESYGAGLIDFWALGRNSYQQWYNQSYWSDGTSDGLPGNDSVHPGDLGHAYMASVIQPYIMASVPT